MSTSILGSLEGGDIGEVLSVGGYAVQYVDGWAAGMPFYRLKFLDGPWAGLAPWFEMDDDGTVVYEENVNSDGFGFNWRSEVPLSDFQVESDLLPIPSGTTLAVRR